MSQYRVRKQAITGKLVLQEQVADGGGRVPIAPSGTLWQWRDATDVPEATFELVAAADLRVLITRVERYDRRAKAQREAATKRAQKATLEGQSG